MLNTICILALTHTVYKTCTKKKNTVVFRCCAISQTKYSHFYKTVDMS